MDMTQCALSCSLFPVPHSLLSASTASSVSLKHTERVPTFRGSYLWYLRSASTPLPPVLPGLSPLLQSVLCSNATPKNFPDYTLDPGQPYDPSFLFFITAVVSQTCLLPACCPHETMSYNKAKVLTRPAVSLG